MDIFNKRKIKILEEEIRKLVKDKEDIKKEKNLVIEELERKVKSLTANIDDATHYVENTNLDNVKLRDRIKVLEKELANSNEKLNTLKVEEVSNLKKEKSKQNKTTKVVKGEKKSGVSKSNKRTSTK